MGIFFSKPASQAQNSTQASLEQNSSHTIPSNLKIQYTTFEKEDLKILILGPGESGKSTYWRQLRNIYAGGLTKKEKMNLIPAIRINLIADIKTIIESSQTLMIQLSSSCANEVDLLQNIEISDTELTPDVAQAIAKVWSEPSAKIIYDQIHSSSLSDHSAYFLDSAARIASSDFMPDDRDVILSRIRTLGVNDIKFDVNGQKVLLVDVGGQRCERPKWKSVFQNVTAIIFVVSLSDFDQCMFENSEERRTTDSLELFKTTVNQPYFQSKPVYLILNKEDELKKKIKTSPDAFKSAYPGFTGDINNSQEVIEYIQNQYLALAENRGEGAEVTPFVTCAVDPEILKNSFEKLSRKLLNISE